jgi:hypothetical protein
MRWISAGLAGKNVSGELLRVVSIASSGNFWPVDDIASKHKYPDPSFPLRVLHRDNPKSPNKHENAARPPDDHRFPLSCFWNGHRAGANLLFFGRADLRLTVLDQSLIQ